MDKPNFPTPPGFRLLDIEGEPILPGDASVDKDKESFSDYWTVRATGIKINKHQQCWYFRRIPEGEAPKTVEGSKLTSGDPIPPGAGAEAPTKTFPIFIEYYSHEGADCYKILLPYSKYAEEKMVLCPVSEGLGKAQELARKVVQERIDRVIPAISAPPVSAGAPKGVDLVEAYGKAMHGCGEWANMGEHERWGELVEESEEAKTALLSRISALEGALRGILDLYVRVAGSGDCGFWDPEKDDAVIEARAALQEGE